MKEQIQTLIHRYEQQLIRGIYNSGLDVYGQGFADGRESELKSIIEDLKELIDES